MASNQKRIVKRVIEAGKRNYSFGIFEARSYGPRECVAILEDGTYQDAVQLMNAPRTESGHSFKGFKKIKATS